MIDLPDHAEQTQWRLAVPHPEDGLFTNDKFRWVRYRQVPLPWSRIPLRNRTGTVLLLRAGRDCREIGGQAAIAVSEPGLASKGFDA